MFYLVIKTNFENGVFCQQPSQRIVTTQRVCCVNRTCWRMRVLSWTIRSSSASWLTWRRACITFTPPRSAHTATSRVPTALSTADGPSRSVHAHTSYVNFTGLVCVHWPWGYFVNVLRRKIQFLYVIFNDWIHIVLVDHITSATRFGKN